jgi:drug/metabolite transporter (DMT)-like permease
MDWSACVVAAAWTGLTAVFGIGWMRCGNGHWRWRKNGTPCAPNAPIYGLLALACGCSAVLFWTLGFTHIAPSTVAQYMNRTLGEAPLILALAAVAMIRRPWDG